MHGGVNGLEDVTLHRDVVRYVQFRPVMELTRINLLPFSFLHYRVGRPLALAFRIPFPKAGNFIHEVQDGVHLLLIAPVIGVLPEPLYRLPDFNSARGNGIRP